MKKSILFFIVISMLLFGGCTENVQKAPKISIQTNGYVSTDYIGTTYRAQISVKSNGDICMKIIEPDALKNVVLSMNSSGCTVTSKGMSLHYNSNESDSLPMIMLHKAFYTFLNSQPDKIIKGENIRTYEYNQPNNVFKFNIDADSGKIAEISTESLVFSFTYE